MTDNIKKFLEEASKNPKMQEKLIKANSDYFQAIIDVSEDQGISLTHEDIALLLNADKNHDGRISDEELKALIAEELQNNQADADELTAVAGGSYDCGFSDCACAFGGGGTEDEYQKTCACVFAGAGELTDHGKELAAEGHLHYAGSYSAPVAMYCPLLGLGNYGVD